MQGVFRKRCDDLVNAYVRASLKREYNMYEISLILEEKMRKERRLLRKRIATLEREKRASDRSIEDLAWEVEQLNFRLKSMEVYLTHEVRSRLEVVETKYRNTEGSPGSQISHGAEALYQQPQAVASSQPVDEMGWTQI